VTGKSLKLAIKEIATGKTDEKTLAHTESLTFADGSFACTFAKKSKGLECTDGGKAVFKGTRVD
jgi:uncharacterized protein (DUF433 family)